MIKNIVLIGMMGSGKTMIAKSLSGTLKIPLLSTDDMVEKTAGRVIKDIVAQDGWPRLRQLENQAVAKAASAKRAVIDCGGGVVLDSRNMDILRKSGIIFFLDAPPDVLYQRLKNDPSRPLLQVADPPAALRKIYQERLPLYKQADHVVDASDASIQVPVVQILKILK